MPQLKFEAHNDDQELLECQVVLLLEGPYPVVVVEPFIFYLDAQRLANHLSQEYRLDSARLIWLEYQLWEEDGKLEAEFRQSEFRWTGQQLVHDGWPHISQKTLKALLELALAAQSTDKQPVQVARAE
jgi:hypothetical protein